MTDDPENLELAVGEAQKPLSAILVGVEPDLDAAVRQKRENLAKRNIKKRRAILVASLIALGAVAGAAAWILGPEFTAKHLRAERTVGASDAASAEFEDWRRTKLDDPLSVRAYLGRYPQGRFAAQATEQLNALENAAWRLVIEQTSAAQTLAELDAYDLSFAQGLHAEESTALRRQTENTIQSVEVALAAQGFLAGNADGVITPETVAAVERYQKKKNLTITGKIDVLLVQQLGVTAVSAGQSNLLPPPDMRTDAAPVPAASATPPGKPFRDCFICPEMVALPPGIAKLGDLGGAGEPDKSPIHSIAINYSLAIGKTEITFDEWDACVSDGGCSTTLDDMGWGRGDRPVINVTWKEAHQFTAWLSRKTLKRYRLLSEAEWEYAARAGSKTLFSFGDDPTQACSYGNHADAATNYSWKNTCSDGFGKQTAPAGSFKPNAFGLYDMHGNVWEWVEDCWHEDYTNAPLNGSAWVSQCAGADRVLRGGSWSVQASNLRSSYRYRFDGARRMPFFGFRIAREGL